MLSLFYVAYFSGSGLKLIFVLAKNELPLIKIILTQEFCLFLFKKAEGGVAKI